MLDFMDKPNVMSVIKSARRRSEGSICCQVAATRIRAVGQSVGA
jgi:hypothetical protein